MSGFAIQREYRFTEPFHEVSLNPGQRRRGPIVAAKRVGKASDNLNANGFTFHKLFRDLQNVRRGKKVAFLNVHGKVVVHLAPVDTGKDALSGPQSFDRQ